MKRLISILIFVAGFCVAAIQGRAEEPQNTLDHLELFSASQLSLPPFTGGERNGIAPSSNKSLVLLNWSDNSLVVKTQYLEKPADKTHGFATQDQSQSQFSALATSSIIDRYLTAEGELAYSSFNSKPLSLSGFGEGQNRLVRFGLKGAWADFMYGAEYRSVGKDFLNLAGTKFADDQDGSELWVQKKLGIFALKLSMSEFTNNVAQYPTLPKIGKLQGGASLSIAPSSWPVLSLFYFKGSQWSSNEPADFLPQTGSLDSVGASLYYKASQWDSTFASTYSVSDITSKLGKEQTTSGRFHLNSSRVQTATPALSLGLNYRPSILPLQITAFGSYSKSKASDGYTSTNLFNLSASLNWTLGESRAGKSTLSLGTTLNRYLDNIDPANSNRDVSVWVRLKLAAF
jgi:hypothetical protein